MTAGESEPPEASFADQAFAATAAAYAQVHIGSSESWAPAIQAAIASLFDFLADRPAQTTACIVEDCGAGPEALARRDRIIDRFVELLRPGFATALAPPPPPIAEAIGGGIYELVRSHVLEQRLGNLPSAAPNATVVALSPFVGPDGAIALADSASPRSSR